MDLRYFSWSSIFPIILFLLSDIPPTTSLSWLSMATTNHSGGRWSASMCSQARKYGFVKRQVKLCRRELQLMPSVVSAAYVAVESCQEIFSDIRWNCSTIADAPNFKPDLTQGTREQAVTYAIAAAALGFTVARECALGFAPTSCSCGPTPNTRAGNDTNYRWGGCHDDLESGQRFSKLFTIAPLKTRAVRSTSMGIMNRHNNIVGIKSLQSHMQKKCKCHGVSGTCTVRTCWTALPNTFLPVAKSLKEDYYKASEVDRSKARPDLRTARASRKIPRHSPADKARLVYLTVSPDYCMPDRKTGSLGTQGRHCDPEGHGPSSCTSMCCGRGYIWSVKRVVEKCHCKLKWCCDVICQTCVRDVDVYSCR